LIGSWHEVHRMDYHRPTTFDEALSVLAAANGSGTVIAGGTDLLIDVKFRGLQPAGLVNVNALPGLRYIREDPDGLRIGALTSIESLARDPLLTQRYAAISDAARRFASLQVRNLATIGGSLGRATPAGDVAPPLLALDATVVIARDGAEREVPIGEFFLGPRQTILQPGELIREIRVPTLPERTGSSYARLSYRDVLDLAIVGVASRLTLGPDGRVNDARVALGAVAPKPIRAPRTEALLEGQLLTEDLVTEAGAVAATEATPISDQRASAEYRTMMVAVLTRRSLRSAAGAAGGAPTSPNHVENGR
jgi:CO/xanthine dehydrogenase FAD-binding subunit